MNEPQRSSAGSNFSRSAAESHALLKPMPSLNAAAAERKDVATDARASAGKTQEPYPNPASTTPKASLHPEKDIPPVPSAFQAAPGAQKQSAASVGERSAEPAKQPAAKASKPADKASGGIKTKNGAPSLRTTLIKRYFVRLTLLTMALCVFLCGFSYVRNKDTAMMRISLNYEEANKGMAPNMVRLKMYDIISDDMLSAVIKTSDFGRISPSALRNCLSLQSSGSGAGDYISIEYILTADLYGSGVQTDAFSLLGLIGQEYVERFYRTYIGDTSKLFTTFLDSSALEYPELVDYYNTRLSIIRRFTSGRSANLKSFRSESTGQTYVDIDELVMHLINIDLEQLNSFVKQTGIIKNASLYLSKLNYQIYAKSSDYERQFQYYGTYTDAIQKYNILQTAVVMVPTYDASGQFYMSMTKTGVDDIAITAQSWNEQSAETRRQIDDIKEIAQSVKPNEQSAAADVATAEGMLKTIDDKLNQIIQLILQVDGEYLAYRYKNPITYSILGLSASQKADIKTNLVICAVFYLALWLIVGRREFRRSRMGGL